MSDCKIIEKENVLPALILGASLVIAVIIGGIFVKSIRNSSNTLTSTGSAKMHVVSDSAKFSGSVVAYGTQIQLPSRYQEIDTNTAKVKAYLLEKGATEEEISIAPVTLIEQYNYSSNSANEPKQYQLNQVITVNSTDVKLVTDIADGISEIAKKGVLFQTNGAQYLYSKLADLRISLLGDAIKDAKARVGEIAKASSAKVGNLKSATSGVVQVLAQNSIDTSDYGTYDTSTIEKDVMVTVRATFVIK
jgi:hypothetical protein